MYVLRNTLPAPDYYEETFYDEVVAVRNQIALVVNEHVKNALVSPLMAYEFIGVINDTNELDKLLAEKENKVELVVKKKVLKNEDLYKKEDYSKPEQAKSWVDSLE